MGSGVLGHAARGVVFSIVGFFLTRLRAGLSAALAAPLGREAAIGLATRTVWPVASKEPAAVAPHRVWMGLDPVPDGTGLGIVVNPGAGPSGNDDGAGSRPDEVLRTELRGAEVVVLGDPSQLGEELERLARDLGVETVDDTIEAIRTGNAIEVDVARIDGRPFLNTASFGSYTEIVDAREQLQGRLGKWPAVAVAVARVLRYGTPAEVSIDGERQDLWAVFIGNCRYEPTGMAPTWRPRLDDRTPAPQPVFRTWSTTNLHVESLDGPLRLPHDGETFDGPGAFDVTKSDERLASTPPGPRKAEAVHSAAERDIC